MGDASTGLDIRKSFDARYVRDSCRTFALLPNGASSSFRGKVHVEDSSLGVSFLYSLFSMHATSKVSKAQVNGNNLQVNLIICIISLTLLTCETYSPLLLGVTHEIFS